MEQHVNATSSPQDEMPLTSAITGYVARQGWDDEVKIDREARSSTLATSLTADGQRLRLYVEANEQQETVTVYLYSSFSVAPAQMPELARLINMINCRLRLGRLACHDDDDSNPVQFVAAYDFTAAQCSPQQIEVMVDAGLWTLSHYSKALAAVALAEVGARASLEAHRKREQAAKGQDSELERTV